MPNPKSKFPQFILLTGPREQTHPLADHLITQTNITGAFQDLAEPIIDSAAALFYDNNPLNIQPETWDELLPFSSPTPGKKNWNFWTLGEWVELQKQRLRSDFGPGILGRILCKTYKENNWIECFPTLIIRDYDEPTDAGPLITAFGQDEIVCAQVGPLTPNFKTPVQNQIWIPVPETIKQAAFLLHEMENLQLA
jgi:hypothetical protein